MCSIQKSMTQWILTHWWMTLLPSILLVGLTVCAQASVHACMHVGRWVDGCPGVSPPINGYLRSKAHWLCLMSTSGSCGTTRCPHQQWEAQLVAPCRVLKAAAFVCVTSN